MGYWQNTHVSVHIQWDCASAEEWSQDAQPDWDWSGWGGTSKSWSWDGGWSTSRTTWSSQEWDAHDPWWAWREPDDQKEEAPQGKEAREILSLLHRGHTVDRLSPEELATVVEAIEAQKAGVASPATARKRKMKTPKKSPEDKKARRDEPTPKNGQGKPTPKDEAKLTRKDDAQQTGKDDAQTGKDNAKQTGKDDATQTGKDDAKQTGKDDGKQTGKDDAGEPKGEEAQAQEAEKKEKEKQARKKRLHARYMRFHRSLVS